jgi:hypothetical protein
MKNIKNIKNIKNKKTCGIHGLDSIEFIFIKNNAFSSIQMISFNLRTHQERPRVDAHAMRGRFDWLVVFAVQPHVASLFGLVYQGEPKFLFNK